VLLNKYFSKVIEVDMPELCAALSHCTYAVNGHNGACVWFYENMETRLCYDWDFVLPKYFDQLKHVKFFVADATNHLRLKRNGFDADRLWPFHTMCSILSLRPDLDLDLDCVQYHFTHLVNNRNDSRYLVHEFLHDQDLLHLSHWSYPENPYASPHLCNLNKWAGLRETQYRQFAGQWQAGTSFEQHMTETDLAHHACSAVSINTETVFHNGGPCYSGKMFKAMMTGRFFMEVSTAGTLADLHVLGFETFPEIIDENYDLVADPHARIKTICEEIRRLSQLPLNHIKQQLISHRDKLYHNFERCRQLHQAIIELDLEKLVMPDFADEAGVVDREAPNY